MLSWLAVGVLICGAYLSWTTFWFYYKNRCLLIGHSWEVVQGEGVVCKVCKWRRS